MNKPYTVALEARSVPSAQRISAEVRFITAIEHALGSADDVVCIYRAWVDASENRASDIDAESTQLAVRWPRAFDTAQRAGLRDLGELPEAHFVARLERTQASAI